MKLLNAQEQEVQNINFGIVDVGDKKTMSLFLMNDSNADMIEISVELQDSMKENEVEIESYPTELAAHSKGKLSLSWKPTLKIKKGLEISLKMKGVELWK